MEDLFPAFRGKEVGRSIVAAAAVLLKKKKKCHPTPAVTSVQNNMPAWYILG